MNLQPRRETITVQEEFLLNTQGLMFKVGGITLDGAAFVDTVKAGTAVMEAASGLFVPYADNAGALPTAQVVFTAHDAIIKDSANVITGAVVKGYLNTSKLTGVTPVLQAGTNQRYIFG